MRDYAIVTKDLTKVFITKERKGFLKRGTKKRIIAVDHVNFKVRNGEIFGLLGPNGAGKTTTIKLLATLLIPDDGEAWVNGYHIVQEADKVRESIGVSLYSDRGLYWKLTGRENLRYFAFLYHLPPKVAERRIEDLLEIVDLKGDADKLVEEYSTGMKAKLNLARALLNDAPILMLDEPTLGLDPYSARRVRELILKLRDEGKTILLTTHNMEEADNLCDKIAIINKGKIVALGTPEDLKRMVERQDIVVIEAVNINETLIKILRSKDYVSYVSENIKDPLSMSGTLRIGLNENSREALPNLLALMAKYKIKVQYIKVTGPSLEDVFITLTKRGFYEEDQRTSTK